MNDNDELGPLMAAVHAWRDAVVRAARAERMPDGGEPFEAAEQLYAAVKREAALLVVRVLEEIDTFDPAVGFLSKYDLEQASERLYTKLAYWRQKAGAP